MKAGLSSRHIKLMHVVNDLDLTGMQYGVIKLMNRLDSNGLQP
jgi:hypothetical protein